MKITDVEVYVVDPVKGSTPLMAEMPDVWTFVRVLTDEGVHGWGEATNFPGNDHPIGFGRGELRLSGRPGLGVDLDVEGLRGHAVYGRMGG